MQNIDLWLFSGGFMKCSVCDKEAVSNFGTEADVFISIEIQRSLVML